MRKTITIMLMAFLLFCLSSAAGAEKVVRFTMTGDCTIGSTELTKGLDNSFVSVAAAEGYDYFFKYFKELFASDDATVINFEGVLQDTNAYENKSKVYRFRGPTDFTNILTSVSIEAACLANNHVGDYGPRGLERTMDAIANAGIFPFRLDTYYMLQKDGIRIAFFAIDMSSLQSSSTALRSTMSYLKRNGQANACVVFLHLGNEYDPKHNAAQSRVARIMVNSGADLVVMHHPHVVQGITVYENRYICYSLGNFVFGGNSEIRTEMWRKTRPVTSLYALVVQAEFTFSDNGEFLGQRLLLIPAFTSGSAPHNDYQPRPVRGEDAAKVLTDVQFDSTIQIPDFDEDAGYAALPYLPAGEPIALPDLATPKPPAGAVSTPVVLPTREPVSTPPPTSGPGTLQMEEMPLQTREPAPESQQTN